MSIKQLREDVSTLSKYKIRYFDIETGYDYGLSKSSPANLIRNSAAKLWLIYILDSLNEEYRSQAEAHELGHLLVMHKPGHANIIPNIDNDLLDCFCERITNYLAHRILIPVLSEEFAISSELHLSCLKSFLLEAQAKININKRQTIILYEYGIKLFEIVNFIPGEIGQVNQLLEINTDVRDAYNAVRDILATIQSDMDFETQKEIIYVFLDELGIYKEHVIISQSIDY